MALNVLSETILSQFDLYFPNMSVYFTPGDSVYSVYSEPEYISYKVLKLYEPKHQVIHKNTEYETFQWEFYGQLKSDSDESVGDYLLYVMNNKTEYSLHFISEDMGLLRQEETCVEYENVDYFDFGSIERDKEMYRSKMF